MAAFSEYEDKDNSQNEDQDYRRYQEDPLGRLLTDKSIDFYLNHLLVNLNTYQDNAPIDSATRIFNENHKYSVNMPSIKELDCDYINLDIITQDEYDLLINVLGMGPKFFKEFGRFNGQIEYSFLKDYSVHELIKDTKKIQDASHYESPPKLLVLEIINQKGRNYSYSQSYYFLYRGDLIRSQEYEYDPYYDEPTGNRIDTFYYSVSPDFIEFHSIGDFYEICSVIDPNNGKETVLKLEFASAHTEVPTNHIDFTITVEGVVKDLLTTDIKKILEARRKVPQIATSIVVAGSKVPLGEIIGSYL
jgi:hypothetical protein